MAATTTALPVDNFLNGLSSLGTNLNRVNTAFPGFYNYMSSLSSSIGRVGASIDRSGVIINRGLGNIGDSFSNNIRNIHNKMNPSSFITNAIVFSSIFPMQKKITEAIAKPIKDIGENVGVIKTFSSGFTGINYTLDSFKAQIKNPLEMYEKIYQTKILLTSSLGSEKKGDIAIKTALSLAKQYPITAPESLTMLSRLSVHPRVKKYLGDSSFQKELMESISGLSMIAPEQGFRGAMFSIIKAMGGTWVSLQRRFNLSPKVIESLSGISREEMSSDPRKLISSLHKFISKSVGLDVLEKQKYSFTKQVGLFGDILYTASRNIFDSIGLYTSVTGAATGVRAGVSALGDNREFINYASSLFSPFQNKLDNAMAQFAGIGVGTYKTMPIAQVVEAMEKNFKGMSMNEIGTRFEGLIDNMGDIQEEQMLKLDNITSSKFGKVLGDIGGNIASVASKSFSNMTSAVIKGLGRSIINNPADVIKPAITLASPVVGIVGGIKISSALIEKGIESGAFSRIGSAVRSGMSATSSFSGGLRTALKFAAPALLGYQGYNIASSMGYSENVSRLAGIGTGGLALGGLGVARSLMGSGAFNSSLLKIGGLGGGLALLSTGLEIFNASIKSKKEIAEQEKTFRNEINNISDINVDKSLLMSAGTNILGKSDSLRNAAGMKSMMNNALMKSLLIGGGAAAAIFSGGAAIPLLLGLGAASYGTSQAGKDYFKGRSEPLNEMEGLMGLIRSFLGGADYYNKNIKSTDESISNLEFKKAAGGSLTSKEQIDLISLKKIKEDAISNRDKQLAAINTVGEIYNTSNAGADTSKDIVNTSGAYRLKNYLKSDTNKSYTSYLGASAVAAETSSNLTKMMQEGIKENDKEKISEAVNLSNEINKEMAGKFYNAISNVDFKNSEQTKTFADAELGRLKSITAPLGNADAMREYREKSGSSFIEGKILSQIRGALSQNIDEQNMYSSLEVAYENKLAEAGLDIDPLKNMSMSYKDYASRKNIKTSYNRDQFNKYSDKLSQIGITSEEDISKGGYAKVQNAGQKGIFKPQEVAEIYSGIKDYFQNKTSVDEFNQARIGSFKGYIKAMSNNEENITKLKDIQKIYSSADLSKLSEGRRTELQYAMNRSAASLQGIGTERIQEIAESMFGKGVDITKLRDNQINALLNNKALQKDESLKNIGKYASELEKSSNVLNSAFNVSAREIEETFMNSINNAKGSINLFSRGVVSASETTKNIGNIQTTLKDSIVGLIMSGKTEQSKAEKDFSKLLSNEKLFNFLSSQGITSAESLSKLDDKGLSGLDKIRKEGLLTGSLNVEDYDKLAVIKNTFDEGSQRMQDATRLKSDMNAANVEMAFKSSALGSNEFINLNKSMMGINYKEQQKIRESAAKELTTSLKSYAGATSDEEKNNMSSLVDANLERIQSLGLNPYQIRNDIKRFGGGDVSLYDDMIKDRTNRYVSMTNNDVMLAALGKSPDRGSFNINMNGREISGTNLGIENQDDYRSSIVKRAGEHAVNIATAISSANIDSAVNKRMTETKPVEKETTLTSTGDQANSSVRESSNIAALEGLMNKSPIISVPNPEKSFNVN